MSLGPNGVDQVHSLRKILMRPHGTNFCTNCTSWIRFFPSFVQQWNYPKCTQTQWGTPKHEFRVQWVWIRCVCYEKFRCDFLAQTFALIAPVQPILHRVWCSNETSPNAPKHYETHQNMSLGSNGVDRLRSLQKILTRLRGTNICTNFGPFCTEFRKATKQSRMHPNSTKRTKMSVYGQMGWIGCVCCDRVS